MARRSRKASTGNEARQPAARASTASAPVPDARATDIIMKVLLQPTAPFSGAKLSSALPLLDPAGPGYAGLLDELALMHGHASAAAARALGAVIAGGSNCGELGFGQIEMLAGFARAIAQRKALAGIGQRIGEAATRAALINIEARAYLVPSALRDLASSPTACEIVASLLINGPSALTRQMLRSLCIARCFSGAEPTVARLLATALPQNVTPENWSIRLTEPAVVLDSLDHLMRGQGELAAAARTQAIKRLCECLLSLGEQRRISALLAEFDRMVRVGRADGKTSALVRSMITERGTGRVAR